MNRDERIALADALHAFGITFERKVTDDVAAVYERALDGLTAQQIRVARDKALQECRFFPRPAELRAFAGARNGNSVTTAQRALIAWQTVRNAINAHGSYESVYFEDPAVNATVRQLGGWVQLCHSESDRMEWIAKDFARTYEALVAMGVDEHAGRHLPGQHEFEHRGAKPLKPPIRVAIGPAPAPPVRRALPAVSTEVSEEDAARARALVRQLAEGAAAKGGEP